MHSPNEVVSLGDVQGAIDLIARFVRDLPADIDFRD
jgi:acetylornithine deacetylase/succinyl-diaminopimelate desuccinylase-like protein